MQAFISITLVFFMEGICDIAFEPKNVWIIAVTVLGMYTIYIHIKA